MLSETIGSPLHWVGWVLTTGIIILVFHLMGVHSLHTPFYRIIVLFFVVVIVDVIKHSIKLQ